MNWSDETLMAFADGELDTVQHAQVEGALVADAALRQRVAAIQLQRERLAAAFATVLAEPVPDRLARLLQAAPVINLAEVRAKRERSRYRPSWAQWGGMAASVLLGVLLGTQLDRNAADPAIGLHQGRLLAGGVIERALTGQLASEPVADAPVAVQVSFVDKDGNYCRTFSTAAMAGLACREGGQWAVQNLAAIESGPQGEVRQAATALPRAVLDAVDQRIVGAALDRGGEQTAREQGWRRVRSQSMCRVDCFSKFSRNPACAFPGTP